MLDKAHLKDEEEEEKHQKILLQLCINLALTCNKMAEPKRCISWCKRALEIRGIDNTSKTKALYHYGKVYTIRWIQNLFVFQYKVVFEIFLNNLICPHGFSNFLIHMFLKKKKNLKLYMVTISRLPQISLAT